MLVAGSAPSKNKFLSWDIVSLQTMTSIKMFEHAHIMIEVPGPVSILRKINFPRPPPLRSRHGFLSVLWKVRKVQLRFRHKKWKFKIRRGRKGSTIRQIGLDRNVQRHWMHPFKNMSKNTSVSNPYSLNPDPVSAKVSAKKLNTNPSNFLAISENKITITS